MRARFSVPWLRALRPPERGQIDYFDTNKIGDGVSFGLRVSAGGTRTWFLLYRNGGRLQRIKVGRYPDLGLADARARARNHLAALLAGEDPAEARRAARAAARFSVLASDYLEHYARARKKTWWRDQQMLERDVLPRWGRRRAADITRRDVRKLAEAIAGRGAPVLANRTVSLVRRIFNFALERDAEDPRQRLYFLDSNPAARIGRLTPERARDRVLSATEIGRVWEALGETARLSEPVVLVMKLILVTAQRCGEVAGMRCEELDLAGAWWTLPAERSKNGLAHRVPLSPLAVELLEDALARTARGGFLFASPRGDAPIQATSVSHAVHRHTCFGLERWTPHDLRRTAATHMAALGVSRQVLAHLLNHAESGVTAIYDRSSHDLEKRAALEAWAARLEELLPGRTGQESGRHGSTGLPDPG